MEELLTTDHRPPRVQAVHLPTGSNHLLRAVTAARIAAAADRIARTHVILAREVDGATWEQVGEAFGTSRQSAHERFRAQA